MNARDLQPYELMQVMADFLEGQGVSYRVVGSMASMAYAEPRFTNDVDILADLKLDGVAPLCVAFPPPDYYVSESAAREAILRKRQFNILHLPSGLKVDLIIPPDSEFARSELSRGRRLTSEGEFSVWFGSPEDVLLNKLIFYKCGGSEKHLRDVASMLKIQGDRIERTYIEQWVDRLGVRDEWQLVCDRITEGGTH